MKQKVIVEKRNNLSRRVVEGLAVGFGIALGLQVPELLNLILVRFF